MIRGEDKPGRVFKPNQSSVTIDLEESHSSRNSGTFTERANKSSTCCRICGFSAGKAIRSARYGEHDMTAGSVPAIESPASSVAVIRRRFRSWRANSRIRVFIGSRSGTQRFTVMIAAPRVTFSVRSSGRRSRVS